MDEQRIKFKSDPLRLGTLLRDSTSACMEVAEEWLPEFSWPFKADAISSIPEASIPLTPGCTDSPHSLEALDMNVLWEKHTFLQLRSPVIISLLRSGHTEPGLVWGSSNLLTWSWAEQWSIWITALEWNPTDWTDLLDGSMKRDSSKVAMRTWSGHPGGYSSPFSFS